MIGYKEGLNIYIDSLGWKHDESPVVIKETLLEKNEENAECTVIPSGYFRYETF